MKSCLEVKATMVANEFIDQYMAGANGEYVKVYLYVLRHQGESPDPGRIADDLNHTEADVKRALNYWVRQGVLAEAAPGGRDKTEPTGSGAGDSGRTAGNDGEGFRETAAGSRAGGFRETEAGSGTGEGGRIPAAAGCTAGPTVVMSREETRGAAVRPEAGAQPAAGGRKLYTPDQVSRLAGQEDFTQLLYVAQKYMNKVFTSRECEVFAYLYDGLGMEAELLEYLTEYCVQGGHYSIRYLESVALDWHAKGIRSVDMAKDYTATFTKEGFAVMRAFGIGDRRPGEPELQLIRKWFREYGFTKDIVVEACSRTLRAIHKPSFSYADKILTEWKKGGVRILSDVRKMDEKREKESTDRESRRSDRNPVTPRPAKNQFHNFEQRSTNYDAMVLERLKERLGEQKEGQGQSGPSRPLSTRE